MFPLFNSRFSKRVHNENNIPEMTEYGYFIKETSRESQHIWRRILLDWVALLIILVIVFVFYFILKPPMLLFRLDELEYARPRVPTIVPSAAVAALAAFFPMAIIFIYHALFAWDPVDLYAGCFGALLANTIALFFTGLFWVFVGGFRPSFFSECDIDRSKIVQGQIYYTVDICRNKDNFTRDTLHGFPSGHASTAFAGMIYLSTYLAAHLRLYHSGHVWKLALVLAPIIFASYLGFSRIADNSHTPIQILAGTLIGIFAGLLAYRLSFANGFFLGSGRFAHIPLLKLRRLT